MHKIVTKGIILARINYGEADRILTILTPDHGKLRLMAKGVRKLKSKLAGGVELFSISDLTYIEGRGEIGTLVSSRLETHYGKIVHNLERTTFAYEALKLINKVTEDEADKGYFDFLAITLEALDRETLNLMTVRLWLYAHIMQLSGHAPNIQTDKQGNSLISDTVYDFALDDMAFYINTSGLYSAKHIKLLRLALIANTPEQLAIVHGTDDIIASLVGLVKNMISARIL